MWFKGATTYNAPQYKETIMQIIYTTKKDLIKQIESKGLEALSINSTCKDFEILCKAYNIEAKKKEVVKNVT